MTTHEATLVNTLWADAVTLWLTDMNAAGRSIQTIKLRRNQLTRIGRDIARDGFGPWDVSPLRLVKWMGEQHWPSNNTRGSFRAAIRSFYSWALDCELVTSNPARALPKVKPPKAVPRPASEQAYRDALASAGDDARRLMLRLAAELGMRRGEVARAHRNDLFDSPAGWMLLIHGKGNKERVTPVPAGLAAAILRAALAGGNGYLFPGQVDGHLSAGWVGKLVARLLPSVWTMHSLRHRYGSAVRAVGGDVLDAKELLGHEQLNTTQIYVLAPNEGLRAVVEAVGRL